METASFKTKLGWITVKKTADINFGGNMFITEFWKNK